jgi:hypothetical protein
MENFNIAVFGCWNEGFKENSGQRSVYEALKKNQENYQFAVILGDNYYANKKTYENKTKNDNDSKIKISMTDLDEAKRGFKGLNDINLEKKIIFGNHDIKNSLNKDCSVLKSQLKLPWYDVKFPYSHDLYYLLKEDNYIETILMIYLDTTIYDKNIKIEDSCYLKTLGKNHEELKLDQENFIRSILNIIEDKPIYNIKNVIFYGHEPLLTYKEKEKKGIIVQKPSVLENLLDLLFEMKTIHDANFYWVCADYHIYQNGEIIDNMNPSNKINQWIFGTGGGKLDDVVSFPNFSYKQYRLDILKNIIYDSGYNNISSTYSHQLGLNQYGYGEITFDRESVTHKFIKSDYTNLNENQGGGSLLEYNKYLKYKSKYLKLKNKI